MSKYALYSSATFCRGSSLLCPRRRRSLLLGTALGSTLMALSASPSLAADCTQPASPSPITVNGAATPITCTNTVPRTATVAGDNAIGITTTGDGNTVEITNSGQLTTQPGSLIPGGSYSQSTGARGIFAGTNGIGADITIENTGDINSFSDSIKAVDAATIGTIFSDNTHITITNSGNLTAGPNAEGIFARATYGSGNVVTIDNSGSIQTGYSASLSGTSSGIFADVDGNNGLVDITNNGAVNTTGLSAAGISGIASYYNGSGSGVVINNKQNGVITTTGIDAYGIFAQAGSVPSSVGHVNDGGTITVTNAATISAGYIGIGAFTNGAGGDITITNSASITSGTAGGTNASGIMSVAYAGDSTISITNSGAIDTTAGGASSTGIEAISSPAVTGANLHVSVTNTGNITTGADSEGIIARSAVAGGTVTVNNSGSIQTGASALTSGNSTGIYANVDGGNGVVDITNNGAISTIGTSAAGISAIANYYNGSNGSIVIDNQPNGVITTTGSAAFGILAKTGGAGNPNDGGTVTITNAATINAGYVGIGIFTHGANGTILVNNSGNINSAAGEGVYAYSGGDNSSITIGNTGLVDASGGLAALAAFTSGAGSNITITNTGENSGLHSSTGFGLIADATGASSTVLVTNDGVINGLLGGIQVSSTAGSTVNVGTSGHVGADSHLAIQSTTGTVQINNSGVMAGRVELTGAGNVLNVNDGGLFRAFTDSNFGTGANTLNNTGTINASGSYFGSSPNTVSFLGLENFVNGSLGSGAGLTTMIDGVAGDSLTTSGNFTGQGNSKLGVDADFSTGIADTLTIAGNAYGHTNLVVNVTGIPVAVPSAATFIPVVTVDGSTDASNFGLASPVNAGFFAYDLFLDPGVHGLRSIGLSNAAFELPAGMTGAQYVWNDTTVFWQDRMADLRSQLDGTHNADQVVSTPGLHMGGLWARAAGNWSDLDDSVTQSSETFNLDRSQNTGAFLGGVDMGLENVAGGDVLFGVMAGYLTSTLDFKATDDSWRYKGGTVGAYATYLSGGFYLDGLVKADFLNVDINDNQGSIAQTAGTNATNIGLRLDSGYRFATSWGFIEPQASLQWVHTQMDSVSLFGGDVSFDDGSSGRARIGVRIGTDMAMNGMTVSPDLTLNVWNQFGSDNRVGIGFASSAFSASDDAGNVTFGEIGVGVNVASANNWSGVIRGSYRFGDNYSAGTVGSALRYSW